MLTVRWALLETSKWVNIQRIIGVSHGANVVWLDLVAAVNMYHEHLATLGLRVLIRHDVLSVSLQEFGKTVFLSLRGKVLILDHLSRDHRCPFTGNF